MNGFSLNRIFYAVVLSVAAVGATQAATQWLDWHWTFAAIAVAAVEIGGVTLSHHGDTRRQLGERAIPSRLLSAAVAVGAVCVNVFGHIDSPGQAAFFGGLSGLGYLVWVIDSGARRRDALRAAGSLDRVAPTFGLVAWVRHPALTRRAREIALDTAEPIPARVAIATARDEAQARTRLGAVEESLRLKISKAVDPLTAKIATSVYDMGEVAAQLAATADYPMLTGLIARDLTPERLTNTPAWDGELGFDDLIARRTQARKEGPKPPVWWDTHPVDAIAALPAEGAPTSPSIEPEPSPVSAAPVSPAGSWGSKHAVVTAAVAALTAEKKDVSTGAVREWCAAQGFDISDTTIRRARRRN